MNFKQLHELVEQLKKRGLPDETPISVLASGMVIPELETKTDTGFIDVQKVHLVSADEQYALVLMQEGAKILAPKVTYHESFDTTE
ncbi:hypothetical protein EXT65_21040 [Pectobacterium carotovorum subsp. carotovorum]|uniref:hypothetical protein n=1 Tax=Pectobacterium versatile TaxID=2488639 RepID=UPI001F43BF45|nr:MULTISPECIES: hypothetical protein [Pectobacterium]MCL6336282.1 hypothetical protein [Pectobacterium carotovorum subsp. carotovorum]